MQEMRVLMLEDDPNDLELIRRELGRLTPAPTILHVTSETAFVAALNDVAPHVIFCDHNIPTFDGRMALEKTPHLQPDTRIILATGSVNEETAGTYLKAGDTVDHQK